MTAVKVDALPHRNSIPNGSSSSRTNKSAAALLDLRSRIVQEHAKNADIFHPKDVERVQTNDWYVKRFLLAKRRNTEAAYQMLRNALIWRKEMELPDIKDSDFPLEFYKAGGLFSYEPDRDGNVMIYMRIRMHKKVPELQDPMKKFLMHMIDKVDRITDGQGMAIVFDCTGAGISNADMDFLTFIINSGKNYFPLGAKYILVYELPWILNAFWRMAAAIVPAELMGLVKFATKKDVKNLIDPENLPDYMGGTCKRNYRYVPEGCRSVKVLALEYGHSQEVVDKIWPNYEPLLKESELALATGDYIDPPKDEFEIRQEDQLEAMSPSPPPPATPGLESGTFESMLSVPYDGPIIKLTPNSQLEFTYNNFSAAFESTLSVFNPSSRPVAFKIQSNNPAAYTVTPRFGIILENGAINLNIRMLNNDNQRCARDKFLLLGAQVENPKMTIAEFNRLWTEVGRDRSTFRLGVHVHRDSYKNGHIPGQLPHAAPMVPVAHEQASSLRTRLEKIEKKQRQLEIIIVFLLLSLFAIICVLAYSSYFDINPMKILSSSQNVAKSIPSLGPQLAHSNGQQQRIVNIPMGRHDL